MKGKSPCVLPNLLAVGRKEKRKESWRNRDKGVGLTGEKN
jgi:hypothetical protein